MDIWLIAATAATGYIAKQLQNVTKCKDNLLESSSSEDVKQESENKFWDEKMISGDAYRVYIPSTSGENLGNYEDVDSDSLSGLMQEFPEIGHGTWKTCSSNLAGDRELNSPFRQGRFGRRNQQRDRRLTKPMSSLESSLMSRFHREQVAMDDYMTSPFPSPHVIVSRPLLVTNGGRIINKSTSNSLWLSRHTILNEDKAPRSCRFPGLESLVERDVRKEQTMHRKHGLSDATVLLQIGISIGIMSSFMATQAGMIKVKEEVKQTENLVHDIEDLERKDSLIVKEVNIEKAAEDAESISNIEAELEAELERLEINMNSSNTETRLSDIIEMEPDFEVEFAQGELKTDWVKGKRLDETESNQDPSGISTPEPGNYAVSPRELSLRLHKVINSRLEKRITELETALQECQRKVEKQVTESESKKSSWSRLWETQEVMTYKSNSKIPVDIEQQSKTSIAEIQPLVMNLTGEALDAFNDSYDELMKINIDSEDDDSQLEMQESGLHQEDFSSTNKSSPWSHHKDDIKVQEQELLDLIGLEEEEEEEEGSSDLENEMEKQLIKQIVEKTKQGSPVVLNAQKMLFLMEETEQNLQD